MFSWKNREISQNLISREHHRCLRFYLFFQVNNPTFSCPISSKRQASQPFFVRFAWATVDGNTHGAVQEMGAYLRREIQEITGSLGWLQQQEWCDSGRDVHRDKGSEKIHRPIFARMSSLASNIPSADRKLISKFLSADNTRKRQSQLANCCPKPPKLTPADSHTSSPYRIIIMNIVNDTRAWTNKGPLPGLRQN